MQWQLGLHGTKGTRRSWCLCREDCHDGHQSKWEDLTPETEGAGHDHIEGEERGGTDSGIQGDPSEGDSD